MERVTRLTVMDAAMFNVVAASSSFEIVYANAPFLQWMGTATPTFEDVCRIGHYDPVALKREIVRIINSGTPLTRITKWEGGELWYVEATRSYMLGKPVALYYGFELRKMRAAIDVFFEKLEKKRPHEGAAE